MMPHRLVPVVGACAFLVACGGNVDPGGPAIGSDSGPQLMGDPNAPIGPLGAGVATLAGSGASGHVDGAREMARFNNPVNVAVAPDGNVFVADYDNGVVRVVTPAGDASTRVAQMDFTHPFGMAFGADGMLYVQTDNNDAGARSRDTGTIWRVDAAGVATMVARDLGRPRGLAALPDGRLVLVDSEHHTVRLFNPTNAMVTDLAGTNDMAGFADGVGAAARFDHPYDVVVVGDRLVVADENNHRLRAVALDGTVTTFAGGAAGHADGARASALFNHPQGLALDRGGNLYVAETDGYAVRRVAPDGNVTTIAGTGAAGFVNGDPLRARFFGLEGIDVSPDGAFLYVADGNRGGTAASHRVRRIALAPPGM